MNTLVVVILVVAVLILFYKVSRVPENVMEFDCFSPEMTKGIQGFFALMVLVHHISTTLNDFPLYRGEFKAFSWMGVFMIGFFLFCSGYGLMLSQKNKEGYLKGFLVKRVLMVLVPFFICNYIFMFTDQLMGSRYTFPQLIAAFFGFFLTNNQMWFPIEIMLLYLAFYVIFRLVKKDGIRFLLLGSFILCLMTFSLLYSQKALGYRTEDYITNWFVGEWWYNMMPMFLVGMMVAKWKRELKCFALRYYWILLPAVIVLLGGFIVLTERNQELYGYWSGSLINSLKTFGAQILMILMYMILSLLMSLKIQLHNPILEFFGKISLEIILLNGTFLNIFLRVYVYYGMVAYLFVTGTGTVLLAIPIYKLKMKILER